MKAYVPKILMVDVNENYEMMVRKEKVVGDARITFVLHRKNFDLWETVGLSTSRQFFDKPDFDLCDAGNIRLLMSNIDQHADEAIAAYEKVFMKHEDHTIDRKSQAKDNIIPMWDRRKPKQ